MAKKSKKKRAAKVIVNEDGSKSDGFYVTGRPRKKLSPDEIAQQLDAMVDTFHEPAGQRLAETRDWLIKNLRPYLDGPYTWESARAAGKTGPIQALKLDGESGGYFIDADAPLAVEDGIKALHEINCLEHALSHAGSNDLIVKFAINLGVLIERFQLRMVFAEYVMQGVEVKVRRPATMRDEKAKLAGAAKRSNQVKAEAAMRWARNKFPTAAADNNMRVLLPAAAKQLEKSVSTLERWLGIR